jgi:hypothetical protein
VKLMSMSDESISTKPRGTKLARWLAGIYLAWSLLVFFGSLGSESHSWWPIFLNPIIWPLGTLYDLASSVCLDWLAPDAHSAPAWIWTANDYVAGAFYIVVGTIWVWFLGRLLSRGARRYLSSSR